MPGRQASLQDPAPPPVSTPRFWRQEFSGALGGTLGYLAVVVSQGLLAYAALGAAGPGVGMPAAFASVVLSGLVFAVLGRSAIPAGGPSSATSLIFASLVLQVTQDPGFSASQPAAMAALLALMAATVVTMGLCQIVFAVFGLARLARFVPQPVLAGFMNAISVLILLAQLPWLLGWPAEAWHRLGWHALALSQPGPLLLAALTAGAVWLAPRLVPRWPATLVGLATGALTFVLLQLLWPGLGMGSLVGTLPPAWPQAHALAPWIGADAASLVLRYAPAALSTALVLAVIGTLESVLNLLGIDQELARRSDPSRELLALGAANVVGGAIGALPVVLMRTRAVPTLRAGGRSHWSVLLGCAMFALLAVFALPWLALLPTAVLAGIMLTLAVALVDHWTRGVVGQWWSGMRSLDVALNLAVVAVVCVVTVALGFIAGVLLGVGLSMLLFIRSMNQSLLRGRCTAAATPSRRIYGAEQEAALTGARESVTILELQGALFFGSAERVADEAAALPADCRCVVLDFTRVSAIDASGSVVLAHTAQRLAQRGVQLRLAGVTPGNLHGRALRAYGSGGAAATLGQWHADLDLAVEAAELALLAEAGGAAAPLAVPLAASSLCAGLDAAQCDRLLALMQPRSLAAGEWLFREGDPGDRLYVLTAGALNVRSAATGANGRHQRYLRLSPGMMLGETAMLDGRGRSADAVAEEASQVFELCHQALYRLQGEAPALAAQVYRNIAVHLSERLRSAASAWRASAG